MVLGMQSPATESVHLFLEAKIPQKGQKTNLGKPQKNRNVN